MCARRPPISPTLALIALCCAGPVLATEEVDPFANLPVTIILMDDVGHEFIERAATPNIDALTAGGLSFSRAGVCPACSPTRAAVHTGARPAFHNHARHQALQHAR